MRISTLLAAATFTLGASTVSAAPLFLRPPTGGFGFGGGFGSGGTLPGGTSSGIPGIPSIPGVGTGSTFPGSSFPGSSFPGSTFPGSTFPGFPGTGVSGGALPVSGLPIGLPATGAAGCGSYTIIVTRGTGELQGPSIAFRTMVSQALSQAPGGVEYDTVYPASASQVSTAGTTDILNKIQTKLAQCPDHKFALLGYSQGAAATTAAVNQINPTSATFNAIRAVVVVGNPRRTPNLKSDFDTNGGQSERLARGLQATQGGFNANWDNSGKVIDVCAPLDGVCDSATGAGISYAHITAYQGSSWTQTAGTRLIVAGVTRAEATASVSPASVTSA